MCTRKAACKNASARTGAHAPRCLRPRLCLTPNLCTLRSPFCPRYCPATESTPGLVLRVSVRLRRGGTQAARTRGVTAILRVCSSRGAGERHWLCPRPERGPLPHKRMRRGWQVEKRTRGVGRGTAPARAQRLSQHSWLRQGTAGMGTGSGVGGPNGAPLCPRPRRL